MNRNADITTTPTNSPEPTLESTPEETAEALKQQIGRTRSDLGETLSAIEQKLNPTTLREKAVEEIQVVEAKVKEAVREQIEEAKASIKAELIEVKDTIKVDLIEAKGAIKSGLIEAKDNVKKEAREALTQAKQAVRAATIGKVETMARRANETTIEARDSLLDTIWRNPLPTALAGVGLAWLYMNRRSSSAGARNGGPAYYGQSDWRRPGTDAAEGAHGVGATLRDAGQAASRMVHDVTHKASDLASSAGSAASQVGQAAGHAAHDAVDAAGNIAHRVSEGASHLAHDAAEMGSHVADQARSQARRVDDSIRQAMHTNPLVVGATVAAAGALLGLALPRTRREDDLMGASSDHLMERAKGVASDAVGAARQLAQHGIDEVKSAVEKTAHT